METERVVDIVDRHEIAAFSDEQLKRCLVLRAAECTQKSMTGRLNAIIELTEELLARGYARSQARDMLIAAGWHFTPDSFDSALSRVRKRRLRTNLESDRLDKPVDTENQLARAENGPKYVSTDRLEAKWKSNEASPSVDGARHSYGEIFASRRSLACRD